MARKISWISARSIRPDTETTRMTIGLAWRRTARRIKRLKDAVSFISPGYMARLTPDFLTHSIYVESSNKAFHFNALDRYRSRVVGNSR